MESEKQRRTLLQRQIKLRDLYINDCFWDLPVSRAPCSSILLITADRKERQQHRKKKKYEKSLFREWLAKQEQDVEKQEPKEHNQKKAENPNGATQEKILAQKREIDEMRAQAAKVLRAINSIPVEVQMNPNIAPPQSNHEGR